MSVVREDDRSREDSAKVILERRVAYGTRNQRKELVEGDKCSHNLALHCRLLLLQRFQLRIQFPGSDIVFVHSGTTLCLPYHRLVPFKRCVQLEPHLKSLGLSILASLQVTKPRDKFGNLLLLKGRMIIALQIVFCPNGADEGFAFFDPARLCLGIVSSARSYSRRKQGASNYLLFRFETAVFIHSLHVRFPYAGQLVFEILEATCFRPSLLFPISNVFVEVIQPLHDLLIGTCRDER